MNIKKCKNCKYWGKEKITEDRMADNVDARCCGREPFDMSEMKNNDCAVFYGHDGCILYASDFGCINYKLKKVKNEQT